MKVKAISISVLLLAFSATVLWLLAGCQVACNAARYSAVGTVGSAPAGQLSASGRLGAVSPQSLPSRDEEIWVIAKPPEERNPRRSNEPLPGEGQLMARRDRAGQKL